MLKLVLILPFIIIIILCSICFYVASAQTSDRSLFLQVNVSESVSANDSLLISGKLQNLTGQTAVANYPIIIDISAANSTLVRATELTNATGFFTYNSPPISTSSQSLTVRISTPDSSYSTISTVNVQHPEPQQNYLPLFLLIGLIFGAFVVFYYSDYKQKLYVIFGFLLVAAGYAVLAISPPTNDLAINVGFSAALLAPIATIGINQIKNKQDQQIALEQKKVDADIQREQKKVDADIRLRENQQAVDMKRFDTAQNYRDENLKDEVKLLVDYLDELTSHAVQLKGDSITHVKPLSTKMKDRSTASTMANIPTLRMKQYYQYMDEYNQFLVFIQSRNATKDLQEKFLDLRSHYAALEDIMYLNVYYGINFILYRFLSFKDLAQPSKFNRAILKGIWESEMISNDKATVYKDLLTMYNAAQQTQDTGKRYEAYKDFYDAFRCEIEGRTIDIYDDDNSYQLMSYIGDEFGKNYKLIEADITSLRELVFGERMAE